MNCSSFQQGDSQSYLFSLALMTLASHCFAVSHLQDYGSMLNREQSGTRHEMAAGFRVTYISVEADDSWTLLIRSDGLYSYFMSNLSIGQF